MGLSDKAVSILNRVVPGQKLGDILKGHETIFVSAEQTGNGSEQNVAHGLGSVPARWVIVPSYISAAPTTFTKGTADATNCPCTATTGHKYYVVAWKV